MSEDRIRELEMFKERTEVGNKHFVEVLEKLDNTVDTLVSALNNVKGIAIGVTSVIGACVLLVGYFVSNMKADYDKVNEEQWSRIHNLEIASSEYQLQTLKIETKLSQLTDQVNHK